MATNVTHQLKTVRMALNYVRIDEKEADALVFQQCLRTWQSSRHMAPFRQLWTDAIKSLISLICRKHAGKSILLQANPNEIKQHTDCDIAVQVLVATRCQRPVRNLCFCNRPHCHPLARLKSC